MLYMEASFDIKVNIKCTFPNLHAMPCPYFHILSYTLIAQTSHCFLGEKKQLIDFKSNRIQTNSTSYFENQIFKGFTIYIDTKSEFYSHL